MVEKFGLFWQSDSFDFWVSKVADNYEFLVNNAALNVGLGLSHNIF